MTEGVFELGNKKALTPVEIAKRFLEAEANKYEPVEVEL